MVSARTSPTPARVARDPCNCAPIHTHIRPACQPSEHPTCARNYRLLCTLLTLFTYALAGDTRQHCHRLQPLRERAEHAGRPCGCWVNSSPSSAPSADAPVGPMLEIQQLIICARGRFKLFCSYSSVRYGPTSTSTSSYPKLNYHVGYHVGARGGLQGFGGLLGASVRMARAAGPAAGPGSRERAAARRRAPMAASLGETAAGAAPGSGLMADRTRGAARRARPLSAALGVRLFNVRDGDSRAPR